MDDRDLYAKLPGRRELRSPLAVLTGAAIDRAEASPAWLTALSALAAFASVAFAVLLYLNNR